MYRSAYPDKYLDDLAILPAALKSYIPKQLLRNVDMKKVFGQSGLQYVQSVLDNSNDNLKMYGSAERLWRNLQLYMDFPLRRKMFPIQTESYENTIPAPYRTLKGEVLYCKQDYLFHLQTCADTEFVLYNIDQKSKYAELIEYMKKHEERLSGCYEFIKYDHEAFENIKKFFSNAASLKAIPDNAGMKYTLTKGRLNASDEKDFVKVFDTLISKYPCLFLPNSETKDKNATVVVRVFDNCILKFVMKSELYAAINLKNPDRKPLECMDTDRQYRTIEYKRVLEMLRDEISDIDFIYHPIAVCHHRAVPIVAPTGDHCILAADALLDILTETFLVTEVFQKLTRNTCHMIPKYIAILEKHFPSNIGYRYFINLKLFQKIREELEEFWKPIEDRPVEKIRNVGPKGFTVEDVKKELKRLGYTKMFSEISSEARIVYTLLLQKQNPNELETKDMFQAIEACLSGVLFKRFPCLQEFLYRQNVCSHFREKPCDSCLKAFKDADARMEAESMSSMANAFTEAKKNITAIKSVVESTPKAKPELKRIDESAISEGSSIEVTTPGAFGISMESSPEHQPSISTNATSLSISFSPYSYTARFDEKRTETYSIAWKEAIETNGQTKALESRVEEKQEQLSRIRSSLKETSQRCEELEKTIGEKSEEICEKSGAETYRNQEKEELKATVIKLHQQLKDKDQEIKELKKTNSKLEKSKVEELKKVNNSLLELEKRVSQGSEQLKNKDSRIHELKLYNSKIIEEKNEEIEKLRKQQALVVEGNMKEIEQLKRNASKSANEVKKLTAKIAEKESADSRLNRSINDILEKLRKSDSNLQEIIKRHSHLETELTNKNRIIQELQNSAKKQISEQENANEELENQISTMREILDRMSPLGMKEKPDTECLICFYEMKPNQRALKCEHCRKIVHLECASKWLKIHRSCAHCRREQLDPNEFPSLH